MTLLFQSTPPVKAATLPVRAEKGGNMISIHAAREGGDALRMSFFCCLSISIHAAREGGDCCFIGTDKYRSAFQSTPPVKAATIIMLCDAAGMLISIHAAREGGDCSRILYLIVYNIFQSTPPVKAATAAASVSPHFVLVFQSTPPVKAATRKACRR